MMTSLFSIFDPSSKFIMSNWMIFFFTFMIIMQKFMYLNNLKVISFNLKYILISEMKILKNSGHFYFILSLFFLILLNNMAGLLSYVFTPSSHLCYSLSLGLPFWVSFMMTGWSNFNNMFTHLVPLGCPNILMPFMVVIESVSLMIRPITLSVRLAANLTAGHMIMVLLSMGSISNFFIFWISLFGEFLISILELGVAMIQPYVFFTLLTLYAQEIE